MTERPVSEAGYDAARREVSKVTADCNGRRGMKASPRLPESDCRLMLAASGVFFHARCGAGPATVPIIIADTAAPIIIAAVKPKPNKRLGKI